MSIFFDFDVETGGRFRRAVDADRHDIESFWIKEQTEKLFGVVDIGTLIEVSTLSICKINEEKEVIGFMALCDHPNIPGVDPADWEVWLRNMYKKFYVSRNTLFIHFMCSVDSNVDIFLEEAWVSVFMNDVYLLHIVLIVPPSCPEGVIMRYGTFKKRNVFKYYAQRDDDIEERHYLYTARRQVFCPKLRIRRGVEEDNDDIVEILDKKCPKLMELYGEYYISEIIGRYPESKRKVIVADFQERAIGVMCLNAEVNYEMLHKTYELTTYYGLRKATPLEKEKKKRANNILKTFGEPIMIGKLSPFDPITHITDEVIIEDGEEKEKPTKPRESKSKVNFRRESSSYSCPGMRRSFDQLYYRQQQQSDEYSEKLSPTPSQETNYSNSVAMLEGDPFDYDIVNIDANLLTVPELLSLELSNKSSSKALLHYQPQNSMFKPQQQRKSRVSVSSSKKSEDSAPIATFHGEPNAFVLELYGIREDFDERQSFDLLEGAFEIMKIYDYCIIRIPCREKSFPLLQHFCFVPTKVNINCEYALYIAHRSSVLSKFRVRKAEFTDVPQIAQLLQNLDGHETLWTVENSILNRKQHHAYVFLTGQSLVGFGILEPSEQIQFIRAKFNLDLNHIQKYHLKGYDMNAGFSTLKIALVYPVFEVHFRFFIRDMMRLSGTNNLVWLTAYRHKWVIHKANTLVSAMCPISPRKAEIDCTDIPELKKITDLSKNIMSFSTWFMGKRLTSINKANIDTRIVIVGASRTAMAFLDTLLFSDTSTYLTFTNVTLVSPNGLPYVRQSKPAAELMFPRHRTYSDRYLKSVPYTYYVNIVCGKMVEIVKKDKFIKLANGSRCHYDLLFLLFGKQYQHPNYFKPFLDKELEIECGNVSSYIRLDRPRCSYTDMECFNNYDTPDNVFIINNISDANKALSYIKKFSWQDTDYKVLVYGASIHSYCCLSALLEMNVQTKNIIFIEPFPAENPNKIRVPVFSNVYVDQTVNKFLENLQIKTYRGYYFQSWTLEVDNTITRVAFLSHFETLHVECSAFFYYGTRGIDLDAFVAINKSGMGYDGGVLIDHRFRTKNPAIYAAGPATRYYKRYYAEAKRQKYYDSYEIGEKLGIQIKKQLDPLFVENQDESNRFYPMSKKTSELITLTDCLSDSTDQSSKCSNNSKKSSDDVPVWCLPKMKKPKVIQCTLPGGLEYLEVRSPGLKMPHHYVQSLEYNGIVMETFKRGYFKLHLNQELIVDGVTCLTPERCSLDNFKNLYGYSASVLNNVYLKYSAKKIDCFYEFFRSPWVFFLYHENSEELFAMVKELLPSDGNKDTIREALLSVEEKLSNPSFRANTNLKLRSNFKMSAHMEAITAYVLDWLSENDVLLPMYLQPWQVTDYAHDAGKNPVFKKKKALLYFYVSTIKMAQTKPCKPLVLNDLLIQNVNTWGNVQYNIPLRLSNNETRSATSIGHRHIPALPHSLDCKIDDPLPKRVTGRDMVVEKETYKTTTGEYCVKPNPNKAMERSDCSINCRRVIFMTGVEKRLQGKNITQPIMISEMKDNFRGIAKPPTAPPDITVNPPDPEYIFDVVAAGRNEAPVIPDSAGGFRKMLDPYVSTYRTYHKPFSIEDQYGIGAKDHITFYSEFNTPKVRGFGPRFKEIWMPQTAKVHRNVYDRIHVKKECKEVAACHNPVNNIKGVFVSEMKKKYKIPFADSPLASWSHGEMFDLAPFPPNPFQTNIAPFMYCSDYCHIAKGTPPSIVIDQISHSFAPHPHLKKRYVVSRDFEP